MDQTSKFFSTCKTLLASTLIFMCLTSHLGGEKIYKKIIDMKKVQNMRVEKKMIDMKIYLILVLKNIFKRVKSYSSGENI